jgi:hypothetical protein
MMDHLIDCPGIQLEVHIRNQCLWDGPLAPRVPEDQPPVRVNTLSSTATAAAGGHHMAWLSFVTPGNQTTSPAIVLSLIGFLQK